MALLTTKETKIIMSDSHQLLRQHIEAMIRRDLDMIMDDYTEASVIITPDGQVAGLEAIRKMFRRFFSAVPEGATLKIDRDYADGNYAYIVWHASSEYIDIPMGTDTFVVENGKITFQTYAGLMQPKNH